jgi:UDP-glucose 4-epimerase
MKKNRVLITGVAGFIGSNLLDFLLANTDWEIFGLDNLSTGNLSNIEHHRNQERFVFEIMSCSQLVTLKSFKYIFHLAALPRIQPSYTFINDHIQANLNESIHLLELMIKENHFPRIIYSSSSAIYGNPDKVPTNENEKIDCLNPYAFQKYEVEKYLELLSERYPFDYVCLRYFNPYGERSFNPLNKLNAYSSVVGVFLNRRKRGETIFVTGDGSQKRDFIHVSDVANANYLAAIYPTQLNTAFNIGNGSTMSVLQLAKLVSDNIEFIPKREGESEITFADISKANSILKWFPTHNINEFLDEV